ncbi:MAG: NAD(P)-dependent oxidoreductase [Gammaproteobacteria bacterium]|nr:NAD(P)-dependent oxidoreductase [Gammaproteobacteria bacterium]
MTQRIGFIGVGLMGHGMARNLLEKGHPLTAVAHRNRAPLEDLVARGAAEAATPREAAQASDVVIICVTGTPQVEAVVYGEDGVLAGSRAGMIVIDCSTSEPASTARIHADLAAHGVRMADAPLARTPVEAEAGRLNSMVGADEEVFAAIRPILACFCENIFHVGPVGAGHKTKLINNFLAMGHGALIAEALCACAAVGVDIGKFYEVVSAGGANSGIFQLIVPKAMEGDYSGLRFSLPNAEKDLRYFTRMTADVPLTGVLGSAVHHAFVEGLKLGFADGHVGSLIAAQARLNGVTIVSGD